MVKCQFIGLEKQAVTSLFQILNIQRKKIRCLNQFQPVCVAFLNAPQINKVSEILNFKRNNTQIQFFLRGAK